MRALVSGVTGQLGHGLVEVARDLGVEVVPLARVIRGRSARHRVRRAFPTRPELARRALDGDVTEPVWGLTDEQLEAIADIDVVVNVAAETNWVLPASRLYPVNTLGATNGLALAKALSERAGRPVGYCFASSIHVAGGMRGRIAEQRLRPDGARTTYEQVKWLSEEALIARAEECAGAPVAIARIGGLLGNSETGATARRNSLYLLADQWRKFPWGLLPFSPTGRVDMIARDRAARDLWRAVAGLRYAGTTKPTIFHVCAGDSAPTARALFETVRYLDKLGDVTPARPVSVPSPALVWASNNVGRLIPLSQDWHNTIVGARYLSIDRVFERDVLASLTGQEPESSPLEEIARLAFEIRAHEHAMLAGDRPFARLQL